MTTSAASMISHPSNTTKLQEILVQDLYRRAPLPLLLFIPILYVFYLVLADPIAARPAIRWIFLAMIGVLIPRSAAILGVERIRARLPDPRIRIGIFAGTALVLGCLLAAINILAAPVADTEELSIMVIIAAGINSIAIISMSPSLLSYLFYMAPNIASVGVAVMIGPPLQFRGVLLFLVCLNLLSLVVMATHVHVRLRKSIMLRLQVDETNETLRTANANLQHEIAERSAAESALRQRNIELETANRRIAETHVQLLQSEKLASVGQLAAGIAHEINNPLAYVHSNLGSLGRYARGMLDLLDAYGAAEGGGATGPDALRRLEHLKCAANMDLIRKDLPSLLNESSHGLARVERIVRDLREFTRIDRSGSEATDIHECIEQTLSISAHQIEAKAQLVREYGDVPLVECVPAQINQALLNLLLNAAQSNETRGTITIRTGADDDSVWIAVMDTGKGIDPAHIDRIFDPFFTTRDVGSGTGLGLSMVHCVAKQHGGRIDVDSVPGRGTVFTLWLPISAR
ncbi:MAG TPA: ATP-binding protein [Rudaea sp.]|nr:ATP-binding protein [Rudaea sp.]